MQETGNGGDLVLNGNDFELIGGFQNMPYLGMFGGNVEQKTQGAKPDGELAFDYWANNLLMENNFAVQYNSELERRLREVVITSSGRIQLERSVKRDLQFMAEFSILNVDVLIVSADRIQININIQEPENLKSNELVYIWDSTNNELTMIAS